jgi:hypothetical protein
MSGSLLLNSHTKSLKNPQLIAKYEYGDIVGYKKGDFSILHDLETWTSCASIHSEILEITQEDFTNLL